MKHILSTSDISLFLVTLGGNCKNSNVELHDVRWVAGHSINDTIPILRSQWFGDPKGLHIDSYLSIHHVDGFAISLAQSNAINRYSSKDVAHHYCQEEKLWFINLGAYNPQCLIEMHCFELLVSDSRRNAIALAKERWLADSLMQHSDNIIQINSIATSSKNLLETTTDILHLKLSPDKENRSQLIKPDWYGYWRIDRNYIS